VITVNEISDPKFNFLSTVYVKPCFTSAQDLDLEEETMM
jgi:hypothetical protein